MSSTPSRADGARRSASETADAAGAAGRAAERSDWLDHAVRIGLVAYGVVHLMIAWLAVQLAVGGGGGEKASSKGALQQLAQGPFGKVLVWAIAVGMVLLVVWRGVDAAFGHRDEDDSDRLKARVVSAGKGVLYAALALSAIKVAVGAGGGGGTDAKTSTVMDWPGGQVIVVLAGLAIVGYGGYMAYRGWTEKFREHLDTEGQSGESGRAYVLLGRIGYIAKGVSILMVGVLFVYAGATHDPDKSGGLDQALRTLLQQPFGQALLVLVGVGIGGYGLFCFARARHLSR